MYDIDMNNLGQRLREYRKAKNITIEELGNLIGKSKATVNRYETGEILMDILTVLEICNALNIDLNDLCKNEVHSIEKDVNKNPFNANLLYLYYISQNGIVVSSIEIEKRKYSNNVLMKNGLIDKTYKQEYTGILESNYNTAFFCLTNAISNPGLDKFQIEIDLHSNINDMYYGLFLGVSGNTHMPTARKCMITKKLINNKQRLNDIFNKLKIKREDVEDMLKIKYWDMKNDDLKDYVVKL